MNILEQKINPRPLWYPADGGQGGGAGDGGASDGSGQGDGSAGDGSGQGGAGDGGAGDGGNTKLWWEADDYAPTKEWMGKKGLLEEDQGAVLSKTIEGWRNAEARLGKPAESLIERPAEGQTTAEWMRANADAFGLPDKPEGYELAKLELPEGMPVDDELMKGARQIAFDEGIPPAALEKFQGLYAERMSAIYGESEGDLKKANDEMRADLQKDWGDQTDAKIAAAQNGFQALAQQAGMDEDQMLAAAGALNKATGDPMMMKMFAKLSEMMGEDTLKGLGNGSGFTTTPAEAKAKKVQIMAADGDYAKARDAGDKDKMASLQKELSRLNSILANG